MQRTARNVGAYETLRPLCCVDHPNTGTRSTNLKVSLLTIQSVKEHTGQEQRRVAAIRVGPESTGPGTRFLPSFAIPTPEQRSFLGGEEGKARRTEPLIGIFSTTGQSAGCLPVPNGHVSGRGGMVDVPGLEPGTSSLSGTRSNQTELHIPKSSRDG